MGCWFSTCMISNLPIYDNEEVKLVILQPGRESKDIFAGSGYVYETDILAPAFLPISGEVSDGGVLEEMTEDWNTELIQVYLQKNYPIIKVEDEIYGPDNKTWTLERFIRGIERGGFTHKVKDEWVPVKLSFVLIKQDIWDECVNFQLKYIDFYNENKKVIAFQVNGEKYTDFKFNKFLSKIRKVYDRPMEALMDMSRFDDNHEFDNVFHYSNGGRQTMIITNEYTAYCKTRKDDETFLADVKNQWREYLLIGNALENLRKGWMVQPGAGSQDSDHRPYKNLNQAINKSITKRNK